MTNTCSCIKKHDGIVKLKYKSANERGTENYADVKFSETWNIPGKMIMRNSKKSMTVAKI